MSKCACYPIHKAVFSPVQTRSGFGNAFTVSPKRVTYCEGAPIPFLETCFELDDETATLLQNKNTPYTVSYSIEDKDEVHGAATAFVTISHEKGSAPDVPTDSFQPLTLTSTGTSMISVQSYRTTKPQITLEYKVGSSDWENYAVGSAVTVGDGESIQFRAGADGNDAFSNEISYYSITNEGSGTLKASGNIMSLLNADMLSATLSSHCFKYLFHRLQSLTDASELKLPAKTLANNSYEGMFKDCQNLTGAPKLPATTLADSCYYAMFLGCRELVSAPELPATALDDYCYSEMFVGCPITAAPELPATALTEGCYQAMFFGCGKLKSAPELPATILAAHCYEDMFRNCSHLSYIKMMAVDVSAPNCLNNWVANISTDAGVFVKNINATWDIRGANGIPNGWRVETSSN